MPPFVFPSLLWIGLPIAAAPILIHLINMLRQRRVQWAAMEFLLQSQKKNRTWVLLRQLLLLLLRIAAVLAVVLMVAQPLARNQLGSWFASGKTHHVVLLDDSYSMSDRWSDTSAFERATKVISRLGTQAGQQNTPQLFTLLRYSGGDPLLLKEAVDTRFSTALTDKLQSVRSSELAVGPDDVLDSLTRLLGSGAEETRIIYLVSDFRSKDWNQPASIRKKLASLREAGVRIQLVDCVDAAHANLTIASLKPTSSVRAVGVGIKMELNVTNFGAEPAREVSVKILEDGHERPGLLFEEIRPGETSSRTFEAKFLAAGPHRVIVQLPADAVAADNTRTIVLEIARTVPVLIVDGDPLAGRNRGDAYFLASALAPPGGTPTGIKPQLEQAKFLREKPLDEFAAIYVLNVERLDALAVQALEQYVKRGGGVAFFVGDRTRADFMNKSLYRQGEGLFPVPLVDSTELLVNRAEKTPDLDVTNHPIFKIFATERNPFINTVNVEKYFAIQRDWKPAENSTVKILARLRTGVPLVVERQFGEGRVVAFLTTAAPTWNNWGRNNPSYVVALLELQSYLAETRQQDLSRQVGTPWTLYLDPAKYVRQVRFVTPETASARTIMVDAEPTDRGNRAVLADTRESGTYEAQLTRQDGRTESRLVAYNVVAEEGNLIILDGPQLAQRLEGLNCEFHRAEDLTFNGRDLAGVNLGHSILYVLIGVLLAEQVLAYFVSYHRAPQGAAAR